MLFPSFRPTPAASLLLSSTHVADTGDKVFIRASLIDALSGATFSESGLFSICAKGDGRTIFSGCWVVRLVFVGRKSSTLDSRMPIWTVAEDSTDDSLLCPLPSQGFTIGGGLYDSLLEFVVIGEYAVGGSVAAAVVGLLGNREYDCLLDFDGDVAEGG